MRGYTGMIVTENELDHCDKMFKGDLEGPHQSLEIRHIYEIANTGSES
jgi:hypothetical protein